jgi:uncharacterized protein
MSDGLHCIGAKAPVSLTRDGFFQLGGVRRQGALLISTREVFAWTTPRPLREQDILAFLAGLAEAQGDFLLYGTGASPRFPSPAFRVEIERARLGLEVMDTGAACRTYNVLVAEARLFSAALVPLANDPPCS